MSCEPAGSDLPMVELDCQVDISALHAMRPQQPCCTVLELRAWLGFYGSNPCHLLLVQTPELAQDINNLAAILPSASKQLPQQDQSICDLGTVLELAFWQDMGSCVFANSIAKPWFEHAASCWNSIINDLKAACVVQVRGVYCVALEWLVQL
jgi:hypothetical protein